MSEIVMEEKNKADDQLEQASEKEINSDDALNGIKIQKLEQEIDSLKESLIRSYAETENVRKRYDRKIEEIKEYSITTILKDLLEVMDNFDRALQNIPNEMDNDLIKVMEGVTLTQKELEKVFSKNNLFQIKPEIGDLFDYNVHHAIKHEETEDYPSNTIVTVMQIGYKLGNRLLRPSLVAVAK